MKIAFDENISAAMVRLFKGFQQERGLQRLASDVSIEWAQDYYPQSTDEDYERKSDAPWVTRFAASGGKAVISGDAKMRRKPHERLALIQAGLVVIFFSSAWSEWKFCRKCSLLVHWWPEILVTVKAGVPGFYGIPAQWPEEGKAKLQRLPTDDLRLIKIERQQAQRPAIRQQRIRRRAQAGAVGDLFGDEGS